MSNSKKLIVSAVGAGALILGGATSAMADGGGHAPALADVPSLSAGIAAPTINVGTATIEKATVSYSNSIGSADSFSVGSMTNIGASASASSTPDYDVTSKSTFDVGGSSITQGIGSATMGGGFSSITGSFSKSYTADSIDNNVTVGGIGTNATVSATAGTFSTDISKTLTSAPSSSSELLNDGAGTANGSASGVVGTTSTASANSSQFVSSFAQAY